MCHNDVCSIHNFQVQVWQVNAKIHATRKVHRHHAYAHTNNRMDCDEISRVNLCNGLGHFESEFGGAGTHGCIKPNGVCI